MVFVVCTVPVLCIKVRSNHKIMQVGFYVALFQWLISCVVLQKGCHGSLKYDVVLIVQFVLGFALFVAACVSGAITAVEFAGGAYALAAVLRALAFVSCCDESALLEYPIMMKAWLMLALWLCRRFGIVSSACIYLSLLLFVFCGIPELQNVVLKWNAPNVSSCKFFYAFITCAGGVFWLHVHRVLRSTAHNGRCVLVRWYPSVR